MWVFMLPFLVELFDCWNRGNEPHFRHEIPKKLLMFVHSTLCRPLILYINAIGLSLSFSLMLTVLLIHTPSPYQMALYIRWTYMHFHYSHCFYCCYCCYCCCNAHFIQTLLQNTENAETKSNATHTCIKTKERTNERSTRTLAKDINTWCVEKYKKKVDK